MQNSTINASSSKWIPRLAKMGLSAKGVIYCLTGMLAFMGALELGQHSNKSTGSNGIFKWVQQQFAGQILLALLIIGLLCYCAWRAVQCFFDTEDKGKKSKGILVRLRYLLSGLVYLSLAGVAIKLFLNSGDNSDGNSNQKIVGQLLAKPFGQYLVGLVALIIAGVGIYQIVYGLRGKYKKHVSTLDLPGKSATLLLRSGTIGYVSRGVVWLILSWLMCKAAIDANSKEAGDTSQAFQFVKHGSYGSLLAGILGLGLVLYGVFNFIRARYERFNT